MTAIVNTNFSGATVTYNGVQFGGADAAFKTTLPRYGISAEYVPDDSGRVVKFTRYTLTVGTVVYEGREADVAANASAMKLRLSKHGCELKIEGTGSGFGAIRDVEGGPKVLYCEWQPIGNLAWELVFVIKFSVVECASQNHPPLAFLSFGYEQTWQNDFEGTCQRTISGYAEIPQYRLATNPKIVAHVADEVRNSILILCPPGFRRTSNVWHESADKSRLDFVVVDEQMTGDALPPGITLASGSFGFGSSGPGFNKATTTLSMSLRTAPGVPPSRAGIVFLTAALKKQNDMISGNPKGSVIPASLSIMHRKFNDSRITECSMSWHVTKCLNEMMKAARIWEPIGDNNYPLWRTSIENLWHNRGTAGLSSLANEAVIIDLCSNATAAIIGNSPVQFRSYADLNQFQFSCPPIPEDGGWLGHRLRLFVVRLERQTQHKLAKEYLPAAGDTGSAAPSGTFALGGPSYDQSANEQDITEYHGFPDVYVGMQFKGLRVARVPDAPQVKTIGGKPARLVKSSPMIPEPVFDILGGCPVWFVNVVRVYRISGGVQSSKTTQSETSCGASEQREGNY